MEKDLGYVSIEDYTKDISKITDDASQVINKLRKEINNQRLLIKAMIKSCGTIRVDNFDLRASNINYHVIPVAETNELIFRLDNIKEE
jgi:hypothetical protein